MGFSPVNMRTAASMIAMAALAVGLAGCDLINPGGAALKEFQASPVGNELAACAGVRGTVDWSIKDLPDTSKTHVRLITAVVKKGGETMSIGYEYNSVTKVHEVKSFGLGKDEPDDSTPAFLIPLRVSTFCL